MKELLLSLFLISYCVGYGQTTIWSDDFESTSANWSLNVSSGTNGPTYSNMWEISDGEGGVVPPGCGVTGNGNKTLFVRCNTGSALCPSLNPDGRSKYNAGGIPSVDATTNKRTALTTPISTIGQTSLTLDFDWLGIGQSGKDFAELEYSTNGGTTWTSIWTEGQSTPCSNAALWASASVTLPTACENQADLRFAFNWQNDNDGAGTDPAFAVDNLNLSTNNAPTTGPTASFQVPASICVGDCINPTDLSTGTSISAWNWTFTGAATPNSSVQNPTNICYNTAGSYNITLEVTDANGTDDTTITVNVTACSGAHASFSTSNYTICKGDCIDFTDLSTGSNISAWNWTFAGADTPNSTTQNPTNICYNTAGTFNVTLEITDDNGTDDTTIAVTVNDCSSPNADFTTASFKICNGDCIGYTDQSTGSNISAWNWTFDGASPATSTNQNPTNICYPTPGTYNITLEITDDNGTDTKTYQILVDNCGTPTGPPIAAFTVDTLTVCQGDCISFTDQSSGNPNAWVWQFEGANVSSSTEQNPSGICFDSTGTFNVKLTVSNANGTDQISNPIVVMPAPTITGTGDTLIKVGGTAVLNATPGDPGNVFWVPANNLDCDTCLTVNASPYLTTTYYPSLTGSNGCVGRDTVIVQVKFEEIVDVPTAFSPNGDGVNDSLHVLGVGIRSMDFKIYNRYGQLVYSSTNINKGWDGTLKGKPLNQGVFVYTLKYTLVNGTSGEKSGNVTLIK